MEIYKKPTFYVLDGYEMYLARAEAEKAEHDRMMAEQKSKLDNK